MRKTSVTQGARVACLATLSRYIHFWFAFVWIGSVGYLNFEHKYILINPNTHNIVEGFSIFICQQRVIAGNAKALWRVVCLIKRKGDSTQNLLLITKPFFVCLFDCTLYTARTKRNTHTHTHKTA